MFHEGFTLSYTPRVLKRRLRNIEHKLKVQRVKLDFLMRSTPEQRAKMPWLKCEWVVRKKICSLQARAEDLKITLLELRLRRIQIGCGRYKYSKLVEEDEQERKEGRL